MSYKIYVKRFILSLLVILLLTCNTAYADIDVSENIKAALVGDAESGEIFYEYQSNEAVELASVTKLMTYLVTREEVEKGTVSLSDDVIVSNKAANTVGSSFGLIEGERINLELLMNSILIVSGNDAAVAIAEHVAGSEEAFLRMMENKATEIGITTAKFINPSGMPIDDQETDQNYMSAADIFKLAAYLLNKYPDVVQVTNQLEVVIPERNFVREATNPLLGLMEGVDGLKTGYTDKAGLCLVSTIPYVDGSDSQKDRRVIAVLMGAQSHNDRINKSKELLEYGLYNYFIEKIIEKDQIVGELFISNAVDVNVKVKASEEFYQLVKNGTVLKTEIKYFENIKAPLLEGDSVGTLSVYLNAEKIKDIPVQVISNVEKAGLFKRLLRYISNLLGI
ncbi:MAG: D-alanyl-D-alanine carboxypeptidase [Tissierellales bacterium]|nr:D-alanyl-D-alanine carboxypeptidase [Tissierellales bacterium]MBN2827190.1 D-alanyl-D-alanine carboxypeptidase [Tissierellales bacterium]